MSEMFLEQMQKIQQALGCYLYQTDCGAFQEVLDAIGRLKVSADLERDGTRSLNQIIDALDCESDTEILPAIVELKRRADHDIVLADARDALDCETDDQILGAINKLKRDRDRGRVDHLDVLNCAKGALECEEYAEIPEAIIELKKAAEWGHMVTEIRNALNLDQGDSITDELEWLLRDARHTRNIKVAVGALKRLWEAV